MTNKRESEKTEISVSVRLTKSENARLERVAAVLGFRGVGAMMRSVSLEKALSVENQQRVQ